MRFKAGVTRISDESSEPLLRTESTTYYIPVGWVYGARRTIEYSTSAPKQGPSEEHSPANWWKCFTILNFRWTASAPACPQSSRYCSLTYQPCANLSLQLNIHVTCYIVIEFPPGPCTYNTIVVHVLNSSSHHCQEPKSTNNRHLHVSMQYRHCHCPTVGVGEVIRPAHHNMWQLHPLSYSPATKAGLNVCGRLQRQAHTSRQNEWHYTLLGLFECFSGKICTGWWHCTKNITIGRYKILEVVRLILEPKSQIPKNTR